MLTTPFPAVEVEPGGTASFAITLDTTESRRVDLAVDGAPAGWKVSFRGGGSVIDGVFVDAAKSPDVTLSVEIPDSATSGSNRLTVTATSGDLKESLAVDVKVAEQAAGSVTMTTDFDSLQGSSDQTFSFNLTLKNDTPTEAVFGLQVQGPTGWDVKAVPSGEQQATTVSVAAGATATIAVTATPATDAGAQTYPIKVTATSGNKTASSDLSVVIAGDVQARAEHAQPGAVDQRHGRLGQAAPPSPSITAAPRRSRTSR